MSGGGGVPGSSAAGRPGRSTLGPLAENVTRVTVRGGMEVAVQAPGTIRLLVQSPGFYSLPRTKPRSQLRLPAIHETQVRPGHVDRDDHSHSQPHSVTLIVTRLRG